ncbi:flagellar export protein FliJ [Treponema parvum]|uniref:Flagellar FliJ protein n=1 Tax=Treponema parvum TaxID=138851 RepID=A0A975F3G0_9SPIR|nr:flagellar export protein FliJ [Treponema parvum]QTQ13747.1 flagellar export protein FliJ [Treponema parvum]
MKKFDFPLEKILKLRRFQQEQAEIELGKALQEEQAIQNKLDSIARQHAAAAANIKGSLDFEVISSAQQFFRLLEIQKEALLNDLAEAKLVSEQKRRVLQEKMKKTASLEKLGEEEYEKYRRESFREEEAVVDDIINSHFGRKN